MRCYVNGVEVDQIKPRLSFLDLEDDMEGFNAFLNWASDHYPEAEWEAVFDRDVEGNEDSAVCESVWIGGVPEGIRRGMEAGRIRTFGRTGPWKSPN